MLEYVAIEQLKELNLNTLWSRQNGHRVTDDIKCIFLYAKQLYLSQISRKLFHHEAERAITGSDAYVSDLIELKFHVLNCV